MSHPSVSIMFLAGNIPTVFLRKCGINSRTNFFLHVIVFSIQLTKYNVNTLLLERVDAFR